VERLVIAAALALAPALAQAPQEIPFEETAALKPAPEMHLGELLNWRLQKLTLPPR
jgi:hypothetical protein